ncbi:ganglioside GM2 activator-like [Acropora muricata]|uniref:ganglioside GM2 activator-like n=1 Tax=Acropora millepora TaxID=45264 RepID=UPI001CF3BFDE|nr:ganglioside GM2 activator-like [Acropora millepora]
MIFAQLLAFAILAFAVSDALKLKNCDSRMPVQVKEIKVYPDPVILKKGAKITISGKFTVNNEVGEHYTLDVSIKKKGFWGIWLPVPCFGNCNHNIDCSAMIGLLEGEQCPLAPKREYIVKGFTVTVPDIKLPSLVTSGTFEVTATMKDRKSGRAITCVKVQVKIGN